MPDALLDHLNRVDARFAARFAARFDARGADDRVAHEDRQAVLSRLAQSVPRRWGVVGLAVAVAIADLALDVFPTTWRTLFLPPIVELSLNVWCAWRWRTGRATPRDFWAMLVVDAFGVSGMCALLGGHSMLALPALLVVNAGYGLGLPRAARLHLALAVVLYPAARVIGGTLAAAPPSVAALVVETFCLVGLARIAGAAPIEFTRRLRHTRRRLGALARGDFTQRIDDDRPDDLGFLAASVNRTAASLGELVAALRAEIAERERAESALHAAMGELRESREALAHQAFHDPLTGLANRARFHQRVERALVGPRAAHATVVMIDLDGFKGVNDRLGHAAGDRLLADAAERLTRATLGCDTLARIGGDEFAVLLDEEVAGDAAALAERVIDALREPFAVDGAEARVGASVGVARAAAPGGVVDARETADALLRRADAAMYAAKERGKGRHAVFEPAMLRGGARLSLARNVEGVQRRRPRADTRV